MAVSITTDLVTLWDGNSDVLGAEGTLSGFQRFGSANIQAQVGNETVNYTTTVTSFNFTGRTMYCWVIPPGAFAVQSSGGIRLIIGDGTNTRAYFVAGRDSSLFNVSGWSCVVLNADNLPTQFQQIAGGAQPNLSAITTVGVGFTSTAKAVGNSPNTFIDVCRHGTGLTIGGGTSGDPGTFTEIAAADTSTANAWGIVRNLGAGVFGCQGRLTFGSTSAGSVFRDANKTLLYEERLVSNTFYQLNVQGSSTNTNEFQFGTKLGTGEDATGLGGVSVISGEIGVTVNFDNPSVDILNIYGSSFSSLGNQPFLLSNNTSHEFLDNSVVNSGQVDGGSCIIRNSTFQNTTSSAASLLWNSTINIRNSQFIGNTVGAGIEFDTVGTYELIGLLYAANTFDVLNSSGAEITLNISGGDTPSTTGDAVVVNNLVGVTLTSLRENTEIRVFDSNTSNPQVELAGTENATDGSFDDRQFTFSLDAGIVVDIVVHNIIYESLRINNFQVPTTDTTFPVDQRFDRNYFNPNT